MDLCDYSEDTWVLVSISNSRGVALIYLTPPGFENLKSKWLVINMKIIQSFPFCLIFPKVLCTLLFGRPGVGF